MKFPTPPQGLQAIPWRLPIWIYRLGLGGLMGNRFLLLTHRGRKSGKLRHTVLEVIHSDPQKGEYFVVSGFGTRSQWYRNIKNNSSSTIQIGYFKVAARAEQLDPEEASQMILHYSERYPGNLKTLGKLLGYDLEHTTAGYLAFGREIPVIRFSTRDPGQSNQDQIQG